MNRSVLLSLIAKDIYLGRWLVLAPLVSGGLVLALLPTSTLGFYVGSVLLFCVLIITNVMLVMSLVVTEKTEKALVFVLTLPVTHTQYAAAKMLSNGTCFLVMWVTLVGASLAVIHFSLIPDGLIPFWVTMSFYVFTYYCVLLAVGLLSSTPTAGAAVIVLGNIMPSFLIPYLMRLPGAQVNNEGPNIVWSPEIVNVITVELAVCLLVLPLALFIQSRKKDFI